MSEELIGLIRDRFDTQDTLLRDIKDNLTKHVEKDEAYWKIIDEQQAQLSLVKWLSTGLSGSAIVAWLYSKFGH